MEEILGKGPWLLCEIYPIHSTDLSATTSCHRIGSGSSKAWLLAPLSCHKVPEMGLIKEDSSACQGLTSRENLAQSPWTHSTRLLGAWHHVTAMWLLGHRSLLVGIAQGQHSQRALSQPCVPFPLKQHLHRPGIHGMCPPKSSPCYDKLCGIIFLFVPQFSSLEAFLVSPCFDG